MNEKPKYNFADILCILLTLLKIVSMIFKFLLFYFYSSSCAPTFHFSVFLSVLCRLDPQK